MMVAINEKSIMYFKIKISGEPNESWKPLMNTLKALTQNLKPNKVSVSLGFRRE